MAHYFPHERLDVYGVALRFAAIADELLCTWSSSWAVHGQFDKATESVVTNLVKAARLRVTDAGIYSKFLGIAEDAGTKAAAYLDLLARDRGWALSGPSLTCVR